MDIGQEFINTYVGMDEQIYYRVAKAIYNTLLKDRHLPLHNPNHPFMMYASDGDYSHSTNIRNLRNAVISILNPQTIEERSVIRAFFHSNGSQRDSLEDLISSYYNFVDVATGTESDFDDE
jgi:hypothetical protein